MKKKIYLWSGISLVLLLGLFIGSGLIISDNVEVQNLQAYKVQITETLPPINGVLDVWHTRNGEVITESHDNINIDDRVIPYLHKVLYNDGLESIESWAADGTDDGPFTNISLCNVSAAGGCGTPVGAATESFTAYASCGLTSVTGSVTDNGIGNVTLSHTFTIDSACSDIDINVTRVTNSTGGLWLGKVLSSAITNAQGNDQVTMNITWWATSA